MFIHLVVRRALGALLLVVVAATTASAQFELTGSWAPVGSEDVQNDSLPVDYLGLALTDEGRTRALSYDESQKSMIERQCASWGAAYLVIGPFGFRVSSQMDPVSNRTVSYAITGWEDWVGMVIWMDDRPRPSEHALHTQAGFIRKSGVPLSDDAVIDWRIYRHGDVVTVLMVATDPVYLAEPEIISKSFRLSPVPLEYRAPCVTGYEGREPGDDVPHFAPDKNPFADELVKLYHLPREAVLGYPETVYPEYRKTIKDAYVPPPPCSESCGAAGNFVLKR